MPVTAHQRELIGRGTMLVVAVLLMLGAYKLQQAAVWLAEEEWREAQQRPARSYDEDDHRVAPLLSIAAIAVGLLGLATGVFAFIPMHIMQNIVPGAPVTGENPEPPITPGPFI